MDDENHKIVAVVRKTRMKEQGTDFAYWQSRPIEERLQALAEIRRQYHEWKYGAEPGFERVLTVIKKERR